MAKKTITKTTPIVEENVTETPVEDTQVMIYSRDRSLVRVIVFVKDEFGDITEETKVISGNQCLTIPKEDVSWDIANKIKSGLLRVRIK